MTRGRKRKLPQFRTLEGIPSRFAEDLGLQGLGEPFVAEHLSDDAQACVLLIRNSMPTNVYAAVDSFALAAFAQAWAVHKRAAHEMANPSFRWTVPSNRGGETPNAWIRIAKSAAETMATFGARLGLDPATRMALKLPEQRPPSKFDGLIGRPSKDLGN